MFKIKYVEMTTQDLQYTKNLKMQVFSYDELITHLGSHFFYKQAVKGLDATNAAHGMQYRLSFIKHY